MSKFGCQTFAHVCGGANITGPVLPAFLVNMAAAQGTPGLQIGTVTVGSVSGNATINGATFTGPTTSSSSSSSSDGISVIKSDRPITAHIAMARSSAWEFIQKRGKKLTAPAGKFTYKLFADGVEVAVTRCDQAPDIHIWIDGTGDAIIPNITTETGNIQVEGDVGGNVTTTTGSIQVKGNVHRDANNTSGNINITGELYGMAMTSSGNISSGKSSSVPTPPTTPLIPAVVTTISLKSVAARAARMKDEMEQDLISLVEMNASEYEKNSGEVHLRIEDRVQEAMLIGCPAGVLDSMIHMRDEAVRLSKLLPSMMNNSISHKRVAPVNHCLDNDAMATQEESSNMRSLVDFVERTDTAHSNWARDQKADVGQRAQKMQKVEEAAPPGGMATFHSSGSIAFGPSGAKDEDSDVEEMSAPVNNKEEKKEKNKPNDESADEAKMNQAAIEFVMTRDREETRLVEQWKKLPDAKGPLYEFLDYGLKKWDKAHPQSDLSNEKEVAKYLTARDKELTSLHVNWWKVSGIQESGRHCARSEMYVSHGIANWKANHPMTPEVEAALGGFQ